MSCWHSQTDECAVCRPAPSPPQSWHDKGLAIIAERTAAKELPEGWGMQGSYLRHLGWSLHLGQLGDLLATQGLSIVDAKDRAVLDICSAMKLSDDDPDADPLEPQEHGEDCYIYTDDQRDIAKAELARREKP